MNKLFKVGDQVRMKPVRNTQTNYLADLQSSLSDRDISGRCYDTWVETIEDCKPFTITKVEIDHEENASYEAKAGKYPGPFMINHDDLEAA